MDFFQPINVYVGGQSPLQAVDERQSQVFIWDDLIYTILNLFVTKKDIIFYGGVGYEYFFFTFIRLEI